MLLLLFTLRRPPLRTVVKAGPLDEIRRLVWLNNWTDAANLVDQFQASREFGLSEGVKTFIRAVQLRGNIERIPLPEAKEGVIELLGSKGAQSDVELRILLLAIKADIEFQYDLAAAEASWQEARTLSTSAALPVWTSRADGELGAIDFLNGRIFRAVRRVSVGLLQAEFNGDVASQIRYRTALGEGLNEFGRKADALRFFDKALGLANETPGAYFPFTAYLGKAKLLATDGSLEGIRMLNQGLTEARHQGYKVREARILTVLGEISAESQNYEEAGARLTEAANVAGGAGLNRIEADASRLLASILLERGDASAAIPHARRAVAAAHRAKDEYHVPEGLAILGESEARAGKLEAAEAAFTQASEMVDGLLDDFPHPRHKNTLVATMGRVFQGHFDLALRQLKNPAKAFQVLESAKARGLTDLLRGTGREQNREFPWNQRPAEEAAKLQQELAYEEDTRTRTRLLDRLWELEVRSFQLHSESPGGDDTRSAHITLRAFQSSLTSEEAVLEYLVGEDRSFVLLISRELIHYRLLPSRRELDAAIDAHLAEVAAGRSAQDEARALFRLLFQPAGVLGRFERLVIIPDGSLHRVPFAALVDSDGRYLIESHVISYAPSATVYEMLSRRSPKIPQIALLAIGGVNYGSPQVKGGPGRRGFTLFDPSRPPHWRAIPQSFSEVTDIAAAHRGRSTVFTGSSATESNLKQLDLSTFGVLHLAVHSTLDREFPDRSALVLTNRRGEKEDGLLQTREILGLRLNSELVTLSACDGGVGPIEGITGVNSLVEAFLMAGSRSVVATIWDADDVFTGALMRRFYAYLDTGGDKAGALALAMRELLQRHGPDAVPFYWAGFRIVGDARGTTTGE
ncbi:MAG: CHAT domain-containing protein [Bryobacteraceae bacterium]|nr:CHAT domain-containing protein [Bryobacteraceae bacterium]